MYVRGITILPREDSVMGKGLKKFIKEQCPLGDMATAWELNSKCQEILKTSRSRWPTCVLILLIRFLTGFPAGPHRDVSDRVFELTR